MIIIYYHILPNGKSILYNDSIYIGYDNTILRIPDTTYISSLNTLYVTSISHPINISNTPIYNYATFNFDLSNYNILYGGFKCIYDLTVSRNYSTTMNLEWHFVINEDTGINWRGTNVVSPTATKVSSELSYVLLSKLQQPYGVAISKMGGTVSDFCYEYKQLSSVGIQFQGVAGAGKYLTIDNGTVTFICTFLCIT